MRVLVAIPSSIQVLGVGRDGWLVGSDVCRVMYNAKRKVRQLTDTSPPNTQSYLLMEGNGSWIANVNRVDGFLLLFYSADGGYLFYLLIRAH